MEPEAVTPLPVDDTGERHRSLRPTFDDELDALSDDVLRLGGRVVRTHDFQEGVRAVVVDKDNMPNWSPADLSGVSEADLEALFAPVSPDHEWTPLD